ncbi:MAG: homoserine dehydrogenase [Anaerolineaceae bacterium]|nr:homoserine dehydrogenase [Anaerolineaceae bacterium]
MRTIRLVMVGFGNVGKAFVNLLHNKHALLSDQYGVKIQITGIATKRHGYAIDPGGIDPLKIDPVTKRSGDYSLLNKGPTVNTTMEFIDVCQGDILLENTPVNQKTGQPAINHLRHALERGMHVITANKGPVVHGYEVLTNLARNQGRCFRFESSVMDGAPIFSLFQSCLPASQLIGFHGILNSCTNLLLSRMESGDTLEASVKHAQAVGITETDPSADIDGWDAAIKVAALSTVLLGVALTPSQVDRQGIRGVTPEMISAAKAEGKRWKLVCSARKKGRNVSARVAPECVNSDSTLYSVNGTSSYIQFETDTLPGLGILESNPGPGTTAYGLLSDLITILEVWKE